LLLPNSVAEGEEEEAVYVSEALLIELAPVEARREGPEQVTETDSTVMRRSREGVSS
jgi:hypothetical protein